MLPGLAGAELLAVTTVYGNTDLRARIAAVTCHQLGLSPRLAAGASQPLSGRPVFWAGHEGHGIDGLTDAAYDREASAVEVLHDLAREHAGRLEIVAIGPLTNLATAILSDPAFARRVGHLYVMGGDFRPEPPRPEHNFRSDALATWTVLHAGIPTTVCGYEITTQVLLTATDVERIEAAARAGPLLADQIRRFWQWLDTWVAPEHRQTNSPHDPMALLTAFRPELFEFETVQVDVVGVDGGNPDAGYPDGGYPDAGSVRATPDASSPIRVVRDARFADVKEAVIAALTC